jgi:tetratricopeptide (TPR) repeat protein
MHLHWPLAAILLAQSFYCYSNVQAYPAHPAVSQKRKQNTKQNDWEAIISLTDRAYAEYDRDQAQSRRLFAEAVAKLEAYIKKYETNPARLSYLRVLVRLGAAYQNADKPDQARIAFEQCERHNAFNSPNATLRVGDVEESIANYVKAQLCFLTTCSKPEHKEARTVMRRTGGSRGDEIAPPFSFPTRKRPRLRRGRSPS